jgi:hypothetical protein
VWQCRAGREEGVEAGEEDGWVGKGPQDLRMDRFTEGGLASDEERDEVVHRAGREGERGYLDVVLHNQGNPYLSIRERRNGVRSAVTRPSRDSNNARTMSA